MPNQGFHVDGTTEMEADALNAAMLQRDTAANRPAAGQTGRLFWDTTNSRLERDNGASWDVIFQTDPAAATPGLRTLGTGAAQAAAGNHTHTISEAFAAENGPTNTGVPISEPQDTDHDGASITRTPGAAGRSIVLTGVVVCYDPALNASFVAYIKKDGNVVDTVTIAATNVMYLLNYTDVGPSIGAHTYKITIRNTTVPTNSNNFSNSIQLNEVYNS